MIKQKSFSRIMVNINSSKCKLAFPRTGHLHYIGNKSIIFISSSFASSQQKADIFLVDSIQ